jgi:hypothetical protein
MWGLDLGTTNSTLARWEERRDRPGLVALPGVERPVDDPDRAVPPPGLIPSATQLIEAPGLGRALQPRARFRGNCSRVAWRTSGNARSS